MATITGAVCTTGNCGKLTTGNTAQSATECIIEVGNVLPYGIFLADKCALGSIDWNDCAAADPAKNTISNIAMSADPDAFFYQVGHLPDQFNSVGTESLDIAAGTTTETHELAFSSTTYTDAARCFYDKLRKGAGYHVILSTKCGTFILMAKDCNGDPLLSETLILTDKVQTTTKGTVNQVMLKSNSSAFVLIPLRGAAIAAKLTFGVGGILKV